MKGKTLSERISDRFEKTDKKYAPLVERILENRRSSGDAAPRPSNGGDRARAERKAPSQDR